MNVCLVAAKLIDKSQLLFVAVKRVVEELVIAIP